MIYRFNIEDGEEAFIFVNKCVQMPFLPNKQWDAYIKGNLYHRRDVGTEELIDKRVKHMNEILG